MLHQVDRGTYIAAAALSVIQTDVDAKRQGRGATVGVIQKIPSAATDVNKLLLVNLPYLIYNFQYWSCNIRM